MPSFVQSAVLCRNNGAALNKFFIASNRKIISTKVTIPIVPDHPYEQSPQLASCIVLC